MLDILYGTLLAAFFTHELDAVKRHEWRVLPFTSFLPDHIGEQVFIWVHVPLFAAILLFSGSEPTSGSRIAIAIFAIVHVWLHWVFRNHPKYEFNNTSSWGLILLTGLLGSAYLIGTYVISA